VILSVDLLGGRVKGTVMVFFNVITRNVPVDSSGGGSHHFMPELVINLLLSSSFSVMSRPIELMSLPGEGFDADSPTGFLI